VIGLLVWLIYLGFFDEIKYCFMLVGHTHDDNDQFFLHLSTFLKLKGVRTVDELLLLMVTRIHEILPIIMRQNFPK